MSENTTKKLSFSEKILLSTKKHKRKAKKHSLILLIVTSLVLVGFNFIGNDDVPEVAVPSESRFTASMVGDVMVGRHVEEVVDRYDFDYLFKYASPYFAESDYVTGNFESSIIDEEQSYVTERNELGLYTNREAVAGLEDNGFSVINVANDRTYDFGLEGARDTVEAFHDSNVEPVGVQIDEEADRGVVYGEYGGLTIATLGFNDANQAGETAGLLDADPNESLERIHEANRQSDLVVVHVHGGQEYDSSPTTRQEELMKAYADAGADIVIGHHPHVLQSVDVYNDTFMLYSLGNFVSDQGWTRTRDTAIAQYHLLDDGTAQLELIPFRINEAQPRPIEGTSSLYYREKIFRQLTKDTENRDHFKKEDDRLFFEVDHRHVLPTE
ncbi:CapA family protein [Shouchella sp. 1P09AA]|uniref:CapA family protein n=1 Tax=unclassified Shouchella TaxID=2893065 RepID=UPI0039A0B887